MSRSDIMAKFIFADFVIDGISTAIIQKTSLDKKPYFSSISLLVRVVTQTIFTCMFCYKFWSINNQFSSFLKNLGYNSYPSKSVKVAFALFFIIRILDELLSFWYYLSILRQIIGN